MSNDHFPFGPDQYRQDSFARSCPQTEMERLKAQYHEEKSAYFSHNSSHSSMDVSGMSHQNQYKHQQQHRGHFHNSSISSMNSSFTDMSPTRIIQPMVSNGNGRGGLSEDGFTDSTHPRPGLHHTSGTGVYHHDFFAQSCPQTEMERLKARYLKEKSPYLSQSSTLSCSEASGVQQLERSQNFHSNHSNSIDSDDEDVSLYFDSSIDTSLDMILLSPSSRLNQPTSNSNNFTDSTHPGTGLQMPLSGGAYHSDDFARSCPQTEMERLKAEYLNGKASYFTQKASLSSTGVTCQQQPQHIRCYDSEEDDDVLSLNFNSPLTHTPLGNLSAPTSSRVIQPVGNGRGVLSENGFTDSTHSRLGLHHTSSSAYHPDVFARSCPQTEMERLKAQYMKEKLLNSSDDRQPKLHSGHHSFVPSKAVYQSINYRGNSSKTSPDRGDYFSLDQKFNSKRNIAQQFKDNNKTTNFRDYKDLCNDLGVFLVDSNGAFSADALPSQREAVFDCVKQCKAQIVLMSNTGLGTEEQLQIVRAEVKKFFFSCESAMWASFSSGVATENASVEGDFDIGATQPNEQQVVVGRGVIILVLGPLAPRTGWIKSDAAGCVISASARIRPSLPVLTFIACDFGGMMSEEKPIDHPSKAYLFELVHAEYDKDNLVIVGGNLSSDVAKCPPTALPMNFSMAKQMCDSIQSSGVNISVVCDSSVPQDQCGSFGGDVLVCQKKKSMSILGVELSKQIFVENNVFASPCLVKLNISGWPKKSYAIQPKVKPPTKAETPSNVETMKWAETIDAVSPVSSRQKLITDLLTWQKHLQDFSHNLQGILYANFDKTVQANCLKHLLIDILNRAHVDDRRIDTPGFANTTCLNQLSALLSLPEAEFLTNAFVVEQIVTSWTMKATETLSR